MASLKELKGRINSVKSTQKLLNRGARLTELLKQAQFSPLPFEEQTASIFAGTAGYLDPIATADVTRYEAAMLAWLRSEHSAILGDIRETKDLSNETRDKLKDALEAFGKQFA